MKKEEIERLCKQKEQELLGKYFGKLVHEAAIERPEDIGNYEKELPLQIEEEYYEFLKDLWGKIDVSGKYSLEDILDKRHLSVLMTGDDREGIRYAYDDAKRVTLWERVTKTNHKDVTFYKGLLEEYARELLLCLRCDFIEDIHKLEKGN